MKLNLILNIDSVNRFTIHGKITSEFTHFVIWWTIRPPP